MKCMCGHNLEKINKEWFHKQNRGYACHYPLEFNEKNRVTKDCDCINPEPEMECEQKQ